MDRVQIIEPGGFEAANHFYQRVLNAQLHPQVRNFMHLGNERILNRFCHLHPEVDADQLALLLKQTPVYFRWGGTDLFHTTTSRGERRIVVIETNSCPSGQKSFPRMDENDEQCGYRRLIERTFVPLLRRRSLPKGMLGVLYDKNPMEANGYAHAMADATGEPVALVPCFDGRSAELMQIREGVIEVALEGRWEPLRAVLRYITQRPWNRLPTMTRTLVLNPVVVCLAGGRNKMLAAKAYDLFNAQLAPRKLAIRVPETIWDVALPEVPLWVTRMGGFAVIKVPYSNAGQGVYTITSPRELDAFMSVPHHYDRFIVQSLIGNADWSSHTQGGRFYHVGTMPNRRNEIYVADMRFMVGASPEGFYPVAIYARKARQPLAVSLDDTPSWDMLGTNLSVREPDGSWTTQTDRLLLMDNRDFNWLGLGIDDLIEGYIQSILALHAIDQMAVQLITQKQRFRRRFFQSINPDEVLLGEILGS